MNANVSLVATRDFGVCVRIERYRKAKVDADLSSLVEYSVKRLARRRNRKRRMRGIG